MESSIVITNYVYYIFHFKLNANTICNTSNLNKNLFNKQLKYLWKVAVNELFVNDIDKNKNNC